MQISTIHSFCLKILESNDELTWMSLTMNRARENLYIGKHLRDLGFVNEFYLHYGEIKNVIRKYDEYCIFKVYTSKLVRNIGESNLSSEGYIDFVHMYMDENDAAFPRNKVEENYADSLYNAKFLQIAKSYLLYLDLLKKEHKVDYGQLQIRALDYIKNSPKARFTNILIDRL